MTGTLKVRYLRPTPLHRPGRPRGLDRAGRGPPHRRQGPHDRRRRDHRRGRGTVRHHQPGARRASTSAAATGRGRAAGSARRRSREGTTRPACMRRVAVDRVAAARASPCSPARSARSPACPVIHLDHHYWSPGWVADARRRVGRATSASCSAGDRWVVDGNYGGTLELRGRARRHDRVPRPAPPGVPRPGACAASAPRSCRPTGCPQKVGPRSSSAGSGSSRSRTRPTPARDPRHATPRRTDIVPAPLAGRGPGLPRRLRCGEPPAGGDPVHPSPAIRDDGRRETDRTRARRRRPDRPGVPRGRADGAGRGHRLGPAHRLGRRRHVGRRRRRRVPAARAQRARPRRDALHRARCPTTAPSSSAGSARRATGPPRSAPATGRKPPHPRLLARAITRPLQDPPRGRARRHVPRRAGPDRELGRRAAARLTGPTPGPRTRSGSARCAWTTPAASCSGATDAPRRPTSRPRSRRPPRSPATSSRSRSTASSTSTAACTPPTNADVLRKEDLDLVLVSSPMSTSRNAPALTLSQPVRRHFRLRLGQEVRRLRRRGSRRRVPTQRRRSGGDGRQGDGHERNAPSCAPPARPRCAGSSTDVTPTASRCWPRERSRHGATGVPQARGLIAGAAGAATLGGRLLTACSARPGHQLRQHPQPQPEGLEDRHRRHRDDGEPVLRPLPRLARRRRGVPRERAQARTARTSTSVGKNQLSYADPLGQEFPTAHLVTSIEEPAPFRGCDHPIPGHGWNTGRAQRDHGFIGKDTGNDEFALGYYEAEDLRSTGSSRRASPSATTGTRRCSRARSRTASTCTRRRPKDARRTRSRSRSASTSRRRSGTG